MPNLNQDENCIFCKIVNGTIPCHKIYETEHSLAFLDIFPISEGHTQVIPKYHGRVLTDLPDEYLTDILLAVKKVALSTGVEAYNVVQNNGKLAFQHVDHVHFHVIPKRNETDGLVLKIDENWKQLKVDSATLAATSEQMKSRI